MVTVGQCTPSCHPLLPEGHDALHLLPEQVAGRHGGDHEAGHQVKQGLTVLPKGQTCRQYM
jgi:hypothetical protein